MEIGDKYKTVIPDEMWALLTQQRPPGSPSAYVADTFGDIGSDWNTVDITPGFTPEDYARQAATGHLWEESTSDPLLNALALASRPDNFVGYPSVNVEDRRDETPQQLIARLIEYANTPSSDPEALGEPLMESQGGYQSLPGLHVPTEFGFYKKGPR